MSREIKFRVWDGDAMYDSGEHPDFTLCDFAAMTNPSQRTWMEDNEPDFERYKLMQYTGLKDRNGKEIYEGDIVRVNSDRYMDLGSNVRFQGVVCMDGAGWRLKGQDYRWLSLCDHFSHSTTGAENDDDRFDDCEVIGNIHEHPHLTHA